MRKKIIIISVILLLFVCAGFLYIKLHVLKAKDFKPDTSKEKSVIDLRPSLIAKLQQLVKDGSNGLYVLSIEKINADVVSSKFDVVNASIHIDSSAMLHLDKIKQLPDDIFKIRFNSLHVDGIGIADLLNKKSIDLKGIRISNPVIDVYHKPRPYNATERKRDDTLSLYYRIKGQMKKIQIGNINIDKGTFIDHDVVQKRVQKFNDVSIGINDVLIDSSTQFDTKRFLFAKHATIKTKYYMMPTPDSLYFFKTGEISISGEQHSVTALDIELKPRGNRQWFESKQSHRKEMYHMVIPKIVLSDVDWWAMVNHEKFITKKAEISGGLFSIFLDRSLPHNASIKIDNFPQQMLMEVKIPISVNKVELRKLNITYEEYNPEANKGGIAYFDNINGEMNYVSNISTDIKKHPVLKFAAKGLFMHHVPMDGSFNLDLSKYKTGDFTADVKMDTLDKETINPIAEPLSLFSVKTGQMQKAIAHVEGNNFNAKAKLGFAYTDLRITPLKKTDQNVQIKNKHVTSFIANTFLIKNNNPAKGKELRQPEYAVERDHHGNFFNMIWITILTGILKTIGIPVKLVVK
jgi:hypothetical protein